VSCVPLLILAALGGGAWAGDEPGAPLEPVTQLNNRPAPDNYTTREGRISIAADCIFPRTDYVFETTVATGQWGPWTVCPSFCPADTFVYAIQLLSEPSQGGGVRRGDDTALNSVALACYNRFNGIFQGYITSDSGPWGLWTDPAFCPGTNAPIVAAEMQVEPNQGGGNSNDDTAANDVRAWCADGTFLDPPAYTGWGTWRGQVACPAGTAVCGMRTRVEANQGGGISDDTALNGLSLICCTF
jgi:vitelline membrane outer layer protein I (VOMI)